MRKREEYLFILPPSRCWGKGCQGFKPITFQSWTYFYMLEATAGTRNLSAIIRSWRCVSRNFEKEWNMLNFSILSHHSRRLSGSEFNLLVTERSSADSFWQGQCLICGWRKGSSSVVMDCNKQEVVKGRFYLTTGWKCSTCLKWLDCLWGILRSTINSVGKRISLWFEFYNRNSRLNFWIRA